MGLFHRDTGSVFQPAVCAVRWGREPARNCVSVTVPGSGTQAPPRAPGALE